jgi:hypothetical protein
MRRVALLISRFTIGLLIVSIWTLGGFIVRVSPGMINTDIAWITIAGDSQTSLTISGYNFPCDKKGENTLIQCEGVIENSPLEIAVTYTDSSKSKPESPIGCKAFYAGKAVACRAGFDFQSQKAPFPTFVIINNDLGISQQRLQQLRQQNWVTNTSEDDWIRLANLAALTIGAITIIWLWQYPSRQANRHINPIFRLYQPINVDGYKTIFCLTSGFTMLGLSWFFFFISLLGLCYID